MEKIIIFTGGGSGGHVVPAITLIEKFKNQNFKILYIGSRNGIESKLTMNKVDKYYSVSTGKLRRYFDMQNFIDIFKVILGFIQSFVILLRLRLFNKNIILVSMGGFVSVPVVIAAKAVFIPIIIHEQTSRVGLANKISSIFANKILVSFEDSIKFFPKNKTILTGYPVREEFYDSKIGNINILGININEIQRDILLITGGGNGSKLLNDKVRDELKDLTDNFFIVHQVGQSFINEFELLRNDSYLPVAFIGDELPNLFKIAKVIISRSGAGTVAELLTLGKKSIFIPLKIAQKNEQYHNAMVAQKELLSRVILEDELKEISFAKEASDFKENQIDLKKNKASELIYKEITSLLER